MATLGDLAKLVRSKNAGPFWLTIDIMFDDAQDYRRARDAEIVNRAAIARLYNRDPADIIVVNHDTALAIKVSFPRPQSSGSKLDSDVYGGQQYAPLLRTRNPWLTARMDGCLHADFGRAIESDGNARFRTCLTRLFAGCKKPP